ncbi:MULTISPECIES: hypothetical protein [spotted fever group]|uniref:hypothetical protein n=1 Tax=spotted fever group TaxID=114277 RepID=UPI0012DCE6A6|nr:MULTISPECIES: hypothetical protein [spotted fever group]
MSGINHGLLLNLALYSYLTDGNTANKNVPNKVLFFLLLKIIPEKAKARQPSKPI